MFFILPLIINFLVIFFIYSIAKKTISHKPVNKNTIQTYNGRSYNTASNMTEPNTNKQLKASQLQTNTINTSNNESERKKYNLHGSFKNNEFDTYQAKGVKKDFVSGYDKKYSSRTVRHNHSQDMQYSHTYDGHEPWDSCLPKEKDPWDKNFRA